MDEDSNREENENKRTISLQSVLIGALILVMITAGATYGLTTAFAGPGMEANETLEKLMAAENFDRFLRVLTLARTNHVDEPDVETLLEGAMSGALEATGDPYSVYFDTSEFESFQIDSEGEYEGIGTLIVEKKVEGKSYVTVMTPFPDSPAATTPFEDAPADAPVGLQPNDRIVKVNGKSIVGTPIELAAQLIRGESGTDVKLEVKREGHEELLVFNVTRRKIEVPTTNSKLLTDQIGYLQITSFSEQTPHQVAEELQKLEKENVAGLVLDLRNNPGGRLDAVRSVAEYFVPKGTLVHILSRQEGERKMVVEDGGPVLPFVVLINGGSASASEILAGAIKDYDTAPLIGTTTFGKGSVQTIWKLDNNTGVKITTAEYVTPERNKINGVGLEPEIRVELNANAELGTLQGPNPDNQLQKAVETLKERLKQ